MSYLKQSRLPKSTSNIISVYGKPVTYLVTTEGSYNIETGGMSAETVTSHSINAYKTKASYSETQNPSLIGKDSAVYLVDGLAVTFTPNVGDRIQVPSEGSDYQVVMISQIQVQDVTALWRFICVRS